MTQKLPAGICQTVVIEASLKPFLTNELGSERSRFIKKNHDDILLAFMKRILPIQGHVSNLYVATYTHGLPSTSYEDELLHVNKYNSKLRMMALNLGLGLCDVGSLTPFKLTDRGYQFAQGAKPLFDSAGHVTKQGAKIIEEEVRSCDQFKREIEAKLA